ncbi:MAG: NADH-quinone oxidoreductase subunit NuoI [Thermoleophilia bacterium]|nr:NADH-quinone oxidoreductase subunit NuoI [Thermoleophilia bacterium]
MSLKDIIKKSAFVEILQGMSVTGKYFVGDKVTVEYPKEKIVPYPRFRGMHALLTDPATGVLNCCGCHLCETICPSQCIYIDTSEVDNHKSIDRFDIDLSRCIFCGFCEEVCPCAAIVMTKVYELATYDKSEFYLTKETLVANQVNAHKETVRR